MDGGQVSSGIRPQRVGARRGVAKVGYQLGHFRQCWFGSHTASGVLQMKIVSQCREQARRAYYGAVFEAKKEIPDETNKNVALSIRTPYALPGLLRHVRVLPDFARPDYAGTPAFDPRRCHATGYGGGGQLRPGCRSSD